MGRSGLGGQVRLPFVQLEGQRRRKRRRRSGGRRMVPHRERPELLARHPVHVTLRVLPHVWRLRSRRCFRVIHEAFAAGCDRLGVRITSFCVQGNHLHLLVEAQGKESLARGMQGLGVRLAKALNRVMGRRGTVFAERYHSHVLRTLAEVRNALRYIEENFFRHTSGGRDPGAGRGASATKGAFVRTATIGPRGGVAGSLGRGDPRGRDSGDVPSGLGGGGPPSGSGRREGAGGFGGAPGRPPPDPCALGWFVGRVARSVAAAVDPFVEPRTFLLRCVCFGAAQAAA